MTKGVSLSPEVTRTVLAGNQVAKSGPAPSEGVERVSEPPPFTIDDVRAAIPKECFERDLKRSLYYYFRDFAVIGVFFYLANAAFNMSWGWALAVYPFYCFAQGTMFWANFVVGHDCGHGSFSDNVRLNHFFGHISHTFLLVPYHAWRISHHLHHMNTGSVENDHSFVAPTESVYKSFSSSHKVVRFSLFWFFGWPLYLAMGMHPCFSSHFKPSNPALFKHQADREAVRESLFWLVGFVGVLAAIGYTYGVGWLAYLYFGPWAVFGTWIAVVTHLHHTHPDVPWYQGDGWWYLRGALSSIDRSYGSWIEEVHHNIGTHVVHHIFHKIPHYNLCKATDAVKPLLGRYYRKDPSSAFEALVRNWKMCRFVPDGVKVGFYRV